jgi:hypothetical protein
MCGDFGENYPDEEQIPMPSFQLERLSKAFSWFSYVGHSKLFYKSYINVSSNPFRDLE